MKNHSLFVSLKILINLRTKVMWKCCLIQALGSQIQIQDVTCTFNSNKRSYFAFESGHHENWGKDQRLANKIETQMGQAPDLGSPRPGPETFSIGWNEVWC